MGGQKPIVIHCNPYFKVFANQHDIYLKCLITYLNSGLGDPWAGHTRQCDFEDATIKEPKLTDDDVNFGADDPTASLNNKDVS